MGQPHPNTELDDTVPASITSNINLSSLHFDDVVMGQPEPSTELGDNELEDEGCSLSFSLVDSLNRAFNGPDSVGQKGADVESVNLASVTMSDDPPSSLFDDKGPLDDDVDMEHEPVECLKSPLGSSEVVHSIGEDGISKTRGMRALSLFEFRLKHPCL